MLKFNKKAYQCNPNDFSPFRHDEYNSLKLFPIIGKLERYSGLLYDLAEIVSNPTLFIYGLKYSSFISYECNPYFDKINIINDHSDMREHENTIVNLCELDLEDKVLIENDFINLQNNNIVFFYEFNNSYTDLLLSTKPILLTTFNQNLKDNYSHCYKLSNSDYYLYLNDFVYERFLQEFHYYLKNNELDYDNLIKYLHKNDCIIFMHSDRDNMSDLTLSASTDYALMAKKPIAISKSNMFRHFENVNPSVYAADRPLIDIINSGIEPLQSMYEAHGTKAFLEKFEWIIDNLK